MTLAVPEGWPKYGQLWKREGEPTRRVLFVSYPGEHRPMVFFQMVVTREVHREDWDEWMWWASDAELQGPRMVRLW